MGFLGSPSVRINGLDIESEERSLKSYGLSCRTYLDGAKRSGLPSSELIRLAISEQKTSHDSCCRTAPAVSATPTPTGGGAPGTGSRRTALFAGGIAAVFASACCLGPLLLVTVGISGAWIGNLARLEPFRPLFIVIALVALFLAWRNIYRVQACRPGEVCAVPQTSRIYKVLFWASVALTLLALVYPYFAKYLY